MPGGEQCLEQGQGGWASGPGAYSPPLPTGCFSKDQVYLDGIVRILRHRQTIDFPLLTSLGKVRGHGPLESPASAPCHCIVPWASVGSSTEDSVPSFSGGGTWVEVNKRSDNLAAKSRYLA